MHESRTGAGATLETTVLRRGLSAGLNRQKGATALSRHGPVRRGKVATRVGEPTILVVNAAWIGVVGGAVGAGGAVMAQVVASVFQRNTAKDQAMASLQLSRAQWAENSRVSLREERKAIYVRYIHGARNILADLQPLSGNDELARDTREALAERIRELDPILHELELVASDPVLPAAMQVTETLNETRKVLTTSEASFAEFFSVLTAWTDTLGKRIENLRTAARVDLA